MGSTTQVWTGASCARPTTRIGCTRCPSDVVVFGSSYIRKESEDVKTIKCEDEGVMHSECIGWESCRRGSEKEANRIFGSARTLTKRQISTPLPTSVNKISSATQVTSRLQSCEIATPPEVYKGPIVRVFLNLKQQSARYHTQYRQYTYAVLSLGRLVEMTAISDARKYFILAPFGGQEYNYLSVYTTLYILSTRLLWKTRRSNRDQRLPGRRRSRRGYSSTDT